MSLGATKHWRDALEAMTGERDLDSSAILEYFKPLSEFLEQQNQMSESEVEILITEYEKGLTHETQENTKAEYDAATDLNNNKNTETQVTK